MDIELGHYPNRALSKLIRNFETENAVGPHTGSLQPNAYQKGVKDFGLAKILTLILMKTQNLWLFADQQFFVLVAKYNCYVFRYSFLLFSLYISYRKVQIGFISSRGNYVTEQLCYKCLSVSKE